MDWAAIEEITYSEAQNPKGILGARKTEDGILVQAFIPDAVTVEIELQKGKTMNMALADESGFYAVLIPSKVKNLSNFKYCFHVTNADGYKYRLDDPYSFGEWFTEKELDLFEKGIYYQVYEKMGAHQIVLDKVKGTVFACWAPMAMRVSVVGDFNNWDGRRHQMERRGQSGVYELFIPGVTEGDIYKFEIKTALGEPMLKSDPYGFAMQVRPDNASVVRDISNFEWKDGDWMENRANIQKTGKEMPTDAKKGKKNSKPVVSTSSPLNIYEVHLGSWIRKDVEFLDGQEVYGSEFYNYREIAPKLAAYVKEMGYTHIELMPIMEHPLDESWGYQVTGYYAPTSRYGSPKDFMYFVDYMHGEGIGVILDWVPAHFPKDLNGLGVFDGSHVYEHMDPRQGMHPHWGTYIYNYKRPQVSNFLIANALYWAKMYHVDGIRMDAVASMLYLDYGKNDGEWVANEYGGHENLEAVEFLKHLNSIFKQQFPSALLIAEESTAWAKISGNLDDGGVGFDYKWNMGWMNDFLRYMGNEPKYRSYHYSELTFSMLYQYSENFVLVFSHDEVVHGKGSLATKMGVATQDEKFANLRVAYGYMMTHPGKKLLFMGQEFGQMDEWNEKAELQWKLLDYDVHSKLKGYVQALNRFYLSNPALWSLDNQTIGFEWTNCHSYQENILGYVRRSLNEKEDIFVVCNFSDTTYEKFDMQVPYAGKYKEIFCSDDIAFGGRGLGNKRVKTSKILGTSKKDKSIKGFEGITITIPAMSMLAFKTEKIKKADEQQ